METKGIIGMVIISKCEYVPFVYLISREVDVSPSAASRFNISCSKMCALNLYLTKNMLTMYLSK